MSTRFRSLAKFFVFLKLSTPFLIFVNPILAILISLPLDGMDGFIFSRANLSRSTYDTCDKLLDFYWYTIILIWLILHPLPSPIFPLLLFFYFFRLIGEIFFILRKNRKIFLFFPNIFEALFWFYFLTKILNSPQLIQPPIFWVFLAIIATLKELHEYLVHITDFSALNFLFGKNTFKWKK